MDMNNYTEEQYRPAYDSWMSNQTPEGNAELLKAIDPIVRKGTQMYGDASPNSKSRAKLMALDAMKSYDPKRSRIQSHLLTQMQGLRRQVRKQQEVIRVPERILLESNKLKNYSQEITDELGREPTDAELSDKLGISLDRLRQVRSYQPGMTTGRAATIDPEQGGIASHLPGSHDASDAWVSIVYNDLPPLDQKIMEYTLGLHGHKKLNNQEIAKKLNRSPGSISQRKVKIQNILDQESDLSPFVVG